MQMDSKVRYIIKDADKNILRLTSSWIKQRPCSISLNGITFLQKILFALSRAVTYNSLSFKISNVRGCVCVCFFSTNH